MTSTCEDFLSYKVINGKIIISVSDVYNEQTEGFKLTDGVIVDAVNGLIEIRPNLPCSSVTYKEMIKTFGSYDKVLKWFTKSNDTLNGKSPMDLYEQDFNKAELEVDILLLQSEMQP